MQLPVLWSSHIRVFNLPFCNLLQQSQGQARICGQPSLELVFSLSALLSMWCFVLD